MSVIQTIRDRGTWIIFVIIAVALIAFILQDGAGRGGSAFSNSSVIAKVNGTSIERGDFEERLKSQEAMYAGQGATRDQLIGTVYNMEVDNIVLNQEFEKLGLTVSAKELNDILFGENSPLRQEFTDPNTGLPAGTPPGDVNIPLYYNPVLSVDYAKYHQESHHLRVLP